VLLDRIKEFEKRSWAIKRYASERWGDKAPCPIRFVVNPYHGCSIRCSYCYVWFDKDRNQTKNNFRKALIHDIKRAKEFGVNHLAVEVSSSTDPFQEIEKTQKDALFAIKELLKAGFKVIIVTKNPKILLQKEYIHLLDDKNVFLDITITSLEKLNIQGTVIKSEELTTKEKIDAISKIIERGKLVRVKVEPIIPSFSGVRGQSSKEIEKLIEDLSVAGVKLVIAKTLRLNAGLPESSLQALLSFFKENGNLIGENYVLNDSLRQKLLEPVIKNCQKNNISFCPCCDDDVFKGENVCNCYVDGESLMN
jgi:DNA repair photolyase